MPGTHSFIRRALAVAACAAMLGTAAITAATAGADPTPQIHGNTFTAAPISAIAVRAGGHEATLSFATAEPTYVTTIYKPVTAPAVAGPTPTSPTSVQVFDGVFHATRTYATTHELKLAGLPSNTTYDLTVTAETRAGQKHTAQTRFTTLKQRVRITLREINITGDGDNFLAGDGEPQWIVRMTWAGGKAAACYPNNGSFCEYGSHGEGSFFPRNYRGQPLTWLFAAENFDTLPDSLTIYADVEEYDIVDVPYLGFCGPGAAAAAWQLPRGVEWSSTPVTLETCTENSDFLSTLTFTVETFHDNLSYPSDRNAPSSTW